jgi:hypothetical protein
MCKVSLSGPAAAVSHMHGKEHLGLFKKIHSAEQLRKDGRLLFNGQQYTPRELVLQEVESNPPDYSSATGSDTLLDFSVAVQRPDLHLGAYRCDVCHTPGTPTGSSSTTFLDHTRGALHRRNVSQFRHLSSSAPSSDAPPPAPPPRSSSPSPSFSAGWRSKY